MREIKFRGICSDGRWKYGYYAYCQNTKHHLILDHTPVFSEDKSDVKFGLVPWQVKEDTIGQFTGLKDKNDKEIYEGDIIEVYSKNPNGYYETNIAVVEYHKCNFCLRKPNAIFNLWLCTSAISYLKVIGNIHENSELLEADK